MHQSKTTRPQGNLREVINMKRVTLFSLLVVLLVTVAVAGEPVSIFPGLSDQTIIEKEPAFNYRVLTLTRVIDGDTFEAWIHVAPRLAYFVDVRVDEVDTPEINGDCRDEGSRVKVLVEEFLRDAEAITITFTGKLSFGRWVCIVTVDGVDLAAWIRKNKLAKADLCPEEPK